MQKRKKMSERPATGAATGRRVEAGIRRLRAFHDAGRHSLKEHPDRLPFGRAKRLAKSAGITSADTLAKARRFADPQLGYDTDQLKRLRERCRKAGFALGISHVILLLSVPRRQRDSLERQAIQGRWSFRELRRAIRQRVPVRPSHSMVGRRPKRPRNSSETYAMLAGYALQWRRFMEMLELPPADARKAQATILDELTPSCRSAIEDASEAIQRLEKASRRALRRRSR